MHIFKLPFRSFFILSALAAIFVPMYYVSVLVNGYPIEERLITVTSWHANEMIFGFTSTLLTGFLLTAAPRWTDKAPVSVYWTLGLSFNWILIRTIFIFQTSKLALYLGSSLFLLLTMYKLFLILRGSKNAFIVLTLFSLLLISQNIFIYGAVNDIDFIIETIYRIVAFIISTFLIIFSGKLIPFFVNSKFKTKLSQNFKFDFLIIIISLITTISSIYLSDFITSILAFVVSVLLSIRLKRLFIREILTTPMLWILYLGHLWLNIYFFMSFLSLYFEFLDAGRAVYHSLYAGALGTFAIGMMTRVSLGHSGLEMKAGKMIKFSFYSMVIGSISRVFHPIFLEGVHGTFLHISMGFWTLSFILFLIYFFPKYISSKEQDLKNS